MTVKQPRIQGAGGSVRALGIGDTECVVAAQAICRGELDYRVLAISARVAGSGNEHIALRLGRLLIYIEDRAALDALVRATTNAVELAETIFGAPDDAFNATERDARRRFERKPSTS